MEIASPFNLLDNFLSSGFRFKKGDPRLSRVRFLNGVSGVAILSLAVVSITNAVLGDYYFAIFEGLLIIILLIAVIDIRRTGETERAVTFGIIVNGAIAIDNFLFGGFGNTGLLMIYTFPAVVFFLTGAKKGARWIIALFGMLVVISALEPIGSISLPYSGFTLFMFFISLALISFLIYIYQVNKEASDRATNEALAEIKFLHEVIIDANRAGDLQEMLQLTVNKTLLFTSFDSMGVYLIEQKGKLAHLEYAKKISKVFYEKIYHLDIGLSRYKGLFTDGRPSFITDYHASSPELEAISGFKIVAFIPLLAGHEVIGAFMIASKSKDVFTERIKETLITIGKELGTTIERVKSHKKLQKTLENIELKNRELEKMNRVMIDRELKMIELKKQLKISSSDIPGSEIHTSPTT